MIITILIFVKDASEWLDIGSLAEMIFVATGNQHVCLQGQMATFAPSVICSVTLSYLVILVARHFWIISKQEILLQLYDSLVMCRNVRFEFGQ